jgi:hypothetical protein
VTKNAAVFSAESAAVSLPFVPSLSSRQNDSLFQARRNGAINEAAFFIRSFAPLDSFLTIT